MEFIEVIVLHLGLYFAAVEFLWWWITLCNRFCDELKINCLNLRHLAVKQKAQ
jgi:hypothetical protein